HAVLRGLGLPPLFDVLVPLLAREEGQVIQFALALVAVRLFRLLEPIAGQLEKVLKLAATAGLLFGGHTGIDRRDAGTGRRESGGRVGRASDYTPGRTSRLA